MFDHPGHLAVAERDEMAKAKKPKTAQTFQKSLISLKGDPAWLEWLKEFADSLGVPVTTAIDLSLKDYAKRQGFAKPMPKRLPGQ